MRAEVIAKMLDDYTIDLYAVDKQLEKTLALVTALEEERRMLENDIEYLQIMLRNTELENE